MQTIRHPTRHRSISYENMTLARHYTCSAVIRAGIAYALEQGSQLKEFSHSVNQRTHTLEIYISPYLCDARALHFNPFVRLTWPGGTINLNGKVPRSTSRLYFVFPFVNRGHCILQVSPFGSGKDIILSTSGKSTARHSRSCTHTYHSPFNLCAVAPIVLPGVDSAVHAVHHSPGQSRSSRLRLPSSRVRRGTRSLPHLPGRCVVDRGVNLSSRRFRRGPPSCVLVTLIGACHVFPA